MHKFYTRISLRRPEGYNTFEDKATAYRFSTEGAAPPARILTATPKYGSAKAHYITRPDDFKENRHVFRNAPNKRDGITSEVSGSELKNGFYPPRQFISNYNIGSIPGSIHSAVSNFGGIASSVQQAPPVATTSSTTPCKCECNQSANNQQSGVTSASQASSIGLSSSGALSGGSLVSESLYSPNLSTGSSSLAGLTV